MDDSPSQCSHPLDLSPCQSLLSPSLARSNSVLAAAIEIKTPDLQEVSPTKLPWGPSSF